MSDRSDERLRRIEQLRSLKDDWDSYGAVAPDGRAVDRALVLYSELMSGDVWITASPNGRICFEGTGGTSIAISGDGKDDEIWIDGDE